MSLLSRLAGTDDAQPAVMAPQAQQAAAPVPTVHGSMLVRFGAPVLPVRSR